MEKVSNGISTIADGLIINGNITGEGDMKLAGCVEGEVVLRNGKLIVEHSGYVEGNIEVKEIMISGEVRGKIHAASKVALSSTGKIRGDVKTARIDIAEGAFICGNFEVEDKLDSAK
ncbi:polymer-forming cytoskeletal protein [bacterium]|nr:polymer-forming cytoskeletal protein [candidate division CSSED10-310 bacterium]